MVGLRMFLPEKWTSDSERMSRVRASEGGTHNCTDETENRH